MSHRNLFPKPLCHRHVYYLYKWLYRDIQERGIRVVIQTDSDVPLYFSAAFILTSSVEHTLISKTLKILFTSETDLMAMYSSITKVQ